MEYTHNAADKSPASHGFCCYTDLLLQPNMRDKMGGLKNAGWKEDRRAGQDTFLFMKQGFHIDQIGLGFIFPQIVSYIWQSNIQQASCTQSNKLLKDRTCRYFCAWDSSGPFTYQR